MKYLKITFVLLFSVFLNTEMIAQENFVPVANYSFDDGVEDQTGNSELDLRNSTSLFADPERGNVLRFSADDKSYAVFNKQLLDSENSTISFFFYWEDIDARSWHQLFEIYNFQTGANIYLTPANGWTDGCSLIQDAQDQYGIYEAIHNQSLPKNQWMHLTVTWNDNMASVYIDGQLAGEKEMLITPGAISADSLFLGGNPYRSDNFYINSRIDDIKIYDQTLAPNQIEALSQGNEIPEPLNFSTVWESSGETIQLDIDLEDNKQTIQNFGASDGWNTEWIGEGWPLEKKEKLAEALFSTERDAEGSPKGIGLSSWRFNIGAGTAEQGDDSRISNEQRRTEGFLNSDGSTYNWNKQAGQQWFLKKAANDYKIHHLIGWQNSPPVEFTKYNLGFREYGEPMETILKQEHFNDFARFLADVVEHFENDGVYFDYISPLNEPQYGWSPQEIGGTIKQEGTPWTNQEIHDVVVAIDSEFSDREIDTKLFITEAGAISYHLQDVGHAGNQLYNFWNPNSKLSLMGKPSFANIVSYHSYWQDYGSRLIDYRKDFLEQAQLLNPAPELWQTEYSLLGSGYSEAYPDDYTLTEMECALHLAKVLFADLNIANVTGWQWWTTFERKTGQTRFSLIEAHHNSDHSDGVYRMNKLFYSFGNFSHFIRPGMIRIGTKRSDNPTALEEISGLSFSAYTNSEENELVLLAVNHTEFAREVSLSVNTDSDKSINNPSLFLTDEFNNLKKQSVDLSSKKLVVPARSVATYTAELAPVTSIKNRRENNGFKAYLDSDRNAVVVAFESGTTYHKVSLHNITGKAVRIIKLKNEQNRVELPASNLPAGVYIVTATGMGIKDSKKVVVFQN